MREEEELVNLVLLDGEFGLLLFILKFNFPPLAASLC